MNPIPFFQSITTRILIPALLLPILLLGWGLWFYNALIQEQLLHEADVLLAAREQTFLHYLQSQEHHLILIGHNMAARLNQAFHHLPDSAPEITQALQDFQKKHGLSGIALMNAENQPLHILGLNPMDLVPPDSPPQEPHPDDLRHRYHSLAEKNALLRIASLPLEAGRLLLLAAPLQLTHKAPPSSFILAFGKIHTCSQDCPEITQLLDSSPPLSHGLRRLKNTSLFVRTQALPGLENESVLIGVATRMDTSLADIPLSLQIHLAAGIFSFVLLALFMGKTLSLVSRSLLQTRNATLAIARGDFAPPLPLRAPGEIGLLAQALQQMAHTLEENMKAVHQSQKETQAAHEALKISEDQYRILANTASQVHIGILVADESPEHKGALLYVNDHAIRLCDIGNDKNCSHLYIQTLLHKDAFGQTLLCRQSGEKLPVETVTCESLFAGKPARVYYIRDISTQLRTERQLRDYNQNLENMVEKHTEELRRTLQNLKETQGQLIHSEKMAALGHLAAGVAHEINNPVGFVKSNLGTIRDYFQDLMTLITAQENLEASLETGENPQALLDEIRKIRGRIDIDFIRQDHESVISESMEGIQRVARIVSDLKDFSHTGSMHMEPTDIHQCLESTLNIVWNEIKYKAEVIRDFHLLPEILAVPQKLSQVFMNLLMNAAQAIEKQGVITLRTRLEADCILVHIEDTGCGIPPEVIPRIFDPFFTTKPVGKGTGLGLNISYNLMQQLGGAIEVHSTPGEGSTFTVRIPRRES